MSSVLRVENSLNCDNTPDLSQCFEQIFHEPMYNGVDSIGQVWSLDNLPFLLSVPLAFIAFAKFQEYWQSIPVQRVDNRFFTSIEEQIGREEEEDVIEAEKRMERRRREDEEETADINKANNIFSFFNQKSIQSQEEIKDHLPSSCQVCPQCQGRKWFRNEVCDLCQGKGVIFLNEEDFYLPSKASPKSSPPSDYVDVEQIEGNPTDR
eukprot:gene4078-4362_t